MLKRLFTSTTRVKLLTIFLLNPEQEFFIRELTRELDEQINSIRRELDNLKRAGLLKSKEKNRKKYYVVNKNFLLFNELKSIVIKSISNKDEITKRISQFGEIEVLIFSGIFVNRESIIDLLIVGQIDKEKLEEYLNNELDTSRAIRFSVMSKDDYLYRRKCRDKFLSDLLDSTDNLITIDKLAEQE
jgi:predicted transcriptional regulator